MIDVDDDEIADDHAPPYGPPWVAWLGWRQRVCRRCGTESDRSFAQLPADDRVAWLNDFTMLHSLCREGART